MTTKEKSTMQAALDNLADRFTSMEFGNQEGVAEISHYKRIAFLKQVARANKHRGKTWLKLSAQAPVETPSPVQAIQGEQLWLEQNGYGSTEQGLITFCIHTLKERGYRITKTVEF